MKYEVDYYDPENGATSPIDTLDAPEGYTAEDYISDCESNADDEYCKMLARGKVTLISIED